MIQNRTKRLSSILMLLCLLTVTFSSTVQTIYGQTKKTNYVAFGDSIAAGYGLEGYTHDQTAAPANSYQALTADFLHTQSCNYAVTGDNSDDCIQLLYSQKADGDLAAADIITLSIGSNDLLLPFIQIVTDYFQIDLSTLDPAWIESQLQNGFSMPQIDMTQVDMTQIAEYTKKAEELLGQLSDHPTLHAQATAFLEKFQTIIALLHEKAPEAEIYVTNIYNPFAFVPKIGDLADIYIQEINQAFTADSPDYTLIDVYTPFHTQELTNVHIDLTQPSNIQIDPHPSVEGHAAIAELLTDALKSKHAPKAAEIRSLSSNSKKKLTLKTNLPGKADGYRIMYAAAKNGSYKQLGKATKKTFQTNSKKLKSGKTYYIKVQSYQTIKGVTYYGTSSKAKKVQIS